MAVNQTKEIRRVAIVVGWGLDSPMPDASEFTIEHIAQSPREPEDRYVVRSPDGTVVGTIRWGSESYEAGLTLRLIREG